jgi:hypothetical protein
LTERVRKKEINPIMWGAPGLHRQSTIEKIYLKDMSDEMGIGGAIYHLFQKRTGIRI